MHSSSGDILDILTSVLTGVTGELIKIVEMSKLSLFWLSVEEFP